MLHEIYTNTGFKLVLEHAVFTDLTLVHFKECK